MQGPVGLPGPAGSPGVPGEDGDKASNSKSQFSHKHVFLITIFVTLIIIQKCHNVVIKLSLHAALSTADDHLYQGLFCIRLCCNMMFVCHCRVRLESTARRVPREEKESM